MSDLMLKWKSLLKLTDREVLGVLRAVYPERKLYSISTDWRRDACYILKARGTGGDVIVGWERSVHDGNA